MAVEQQAVVAVVLADDAHRLVDLVVVLAQVDAVVRRVVRLQAASVFTQVDGVEVEATLGEEVGQMGLEEVVDEAVDVQHGRAGRLVAPATDERRRERAFGVAAEVDGVPFVRGAEQIRLHEGRLPPRTRSIERGPAGPQAVWLSTGPRSGLAPCRRAGQALAVGRPDDRVRLRERRCSIRM